MKILTLGLVLLLTSPLMASSNKLGLGVMIGNPTGLNGKYWLEDDKAVDAGLAYSLGKHSDFSLHSDYLLHSDAALYFNETHPLDLYYGIGGRMEFADSLEIGLRIPVGVSYKMEEQQADVFGEAAPIVDVIGRTGFELHLAVGARYYF